MPAVSVIIPMYNVRPYIEDCLLSLKRQTFGDFEALCVDDGSTDGTLEAARKAGDDDARFSFLSQANAGQSAARNAGIARATGKYIVFLDSDDYYEDRALQTLFERAERDEFVRRGFLEESGIRFYEGIVHEDNLFTCLMLAAAPRAAFLNEPLYVRRVRAGSTMTEAREMRHVYGHFKAAYELEAWLRAHAGECSEEFVRALVRHVAFCYDRAAFDALSFDEARLDACAAGLVPEEGASFRLHVMEHARETEGIRKEYLESTTYRVGRAIMALPCRLKERFGR